MIAASVVVNTVMPLLVALVAGGGVAFYAAKPNKDKVVMETTEKAVSIIGATIDRQEKENASAMQRIAVLEGELRKATDAMAAIIELRNGLEARVERLRIEVERLGGDVDEINRVGKRGQPGPVGEKGPPGDVGA